MATENKPRVNFASVQSPYPYPDFLDLQLKSFRDFLQLDTPPEERKNDGLYKVFAENPAEFDPRKYCGPARDLMTELYKHKIKEVLGSDNKLAQLD